jgi:histidinol-phosphate aminotransferase
MSIAFVSHILKLPATVPFVGPEAIERQRARRFELRLGANESAFGISAKAAEAMRLAIEQVSWYGDPDNFELRDALARHHGVSMDAICVAVGIDELLGLVVRLLVEPGTPVVTSDGAYPTFNYHVAGIGGELYRVPYVQDREDPQGLADAARCLNAPLVYLANPDNPMGTWHDRDALRMFIGALPESTVLILDEAYIEFAPGSAQLPVDISDPRVIRMRTFSKAHGMAGARIGYALAAPELIIALNKVRNHFAVNRIAQQGALASLHDADFLSSVIADVEAGREDYYRLAERLGLDYVPSATNFVAIDVGNAERARHLVSTLQHHDVFVRMPGVEPLSRCIRVTVGTAEQRARFADIFTKVIATA